MARKKMNKKLKLPGLFWDGENFIPAEKYPRYTVFTDKFLAETLRVSPMTVSAWREKKIIPFTLAGSSYAIYDVNAVIAALLKAGYQQDPNLKSIRS